MIDGIKDIASIVGGIMTIIAFLSLIMKPTRKKLEAWIRKATDVENTSKRLDTVSDSILKQQENIGLLSTKLDQQQNKFDDSNEQSKKADQQILSHIQVIDNRLDKLDQRVLENERDRIKAELSECASRCARGMKLYPEEKLHIDEIYAKYAEELKCNHRGTEYYHEIVKYYENQDWLKV